MKQKSKNSHLAVIRGMFLAGLLTASLHSMAQKPSVIADPELGKISLTDQTGKSIDASFVPVDQVINLKIPVGSTNHGNQVPAGSCKIKIGFGSKLMLDPQFDLNNSGLGSYFKWTSANNDGQLQVTGELIAPLPANFTEVTVAFKTKGSQEGSSTITANFLITNHNSSTVLSDENGANNASSLAYRVTKQTAVAVPAGKLKLSLYPNPAKDVKAVMIELEQGELKGKYRINLLEMTGKSVQTKEVDLTAVTKFTYDFGNIAAGKYMVKITNADGTQTALLQFDKL